MAGSGQVIVTPPQEPHVPGWRSRRSLRTAATLAVATVGLGLNLRAWILLGPHLYLRFDVGLGEKYALLMALPVLVAALARLPVGVLTDRYGARVMLPAVSLAAAASVIGLALAGPLLAAVVAGAVAGVAGTAFIVGSTLVARTVGYGRRGLALGVFGLGTLAGVAISLVSRKVDPGGRGAALALGAALVGFAGVAALVLRDPVPARSAARSTRRPAAWLVRRCVEMIRSAATTSLSLLYALALGGLVATALYLPVYLHAVVHLRWVGIATVTSAVVGLASVARLIGGWWTDRRPTARLLMVCYAVAAGLCVVVAVDPRRWWLTVPVIAVIAACDGLASGALLALIGKAARADSVGAVMGVTGAVAGLGALASPLLLSGVDRLSHSVSAAWILLAAMLLAAALYVRAYGLRIGMGLAVHGEPDYSPTAMTVAVVGESDTQLGAAAVVARLAELAARDELVVVYGTDAPAPPRPAANVLVTGLRDRLPRHDVVAVRVSPRTGPLRRIVAPLGEAVDTGTVAIAVTPTADLPGVAAELSSYLGADRVLKVSYTLAGGADLQEVWNRGSATTGPMRAAP